MLKVMSIFGTRPEAVKMAPIVLMLERYADQIESTVVVTGQHREMLDATLSIFNIDPDIDLALMQPNQSLVDLTASIITSVDRVIQSEQPDIVLVQGDTTTVMAASLTAFYHKVRVGHVEAGLRSGNRHAPFPEEFNRRIAAVSSDFPLCTHRARAPGLDRRRRRYKVDLCDR